MLPSHHPETEKVVHKNMRMGIGVTGVMQSTKEQLSWLSDCYQYLREVDVEYSNRMGFNTSIKLTTIKPSGTLSLLPGVTPGCHPGYARYMYRRIRIAAAHPLVEACRKGGYPVEFQKNFDGSEDYNTVVVTFPFAYPDNAVLAEDMTAINQLEMVRYLQRVWSDNSVSCTVYYKKEEIQDIKDYLQKYYRNNHKSLSFLLHSGHGFQQAPFEEITKEQFDELNSKVTPLANISQVIELDDSAECSTGACPIR